MIPTTKLLTVCLVLACSTAMAEMHYKAIELPDEFTNARFLTNDGRVIHLNRTTHKVLVWSAGSAIQTIHDPTGFGWKGIDVSPNGSFLGTSNLPPNAPQVAWQGTLDSPLTSVQWESAPSLASPYSASAINDNGVISGTFTDFTQNVIPRVTHAVRLYPDSLLERASPRGRALGIDDQGTILSSPNSAIYHAAPFASDLLWSTLGEFSGIEPVDGYDRLMLAKIGSGGHVVGVAFNNSPGSTPNQAFLSTPNEDTIPLEHLTGYPTATPHSVNRNGQVVGTAHSEGCQLLCIGPLPRAILWKIDGGVADLNTLLTSNPKVVSPVELFSAQVINDSRQILAAGKNTSGQTRSYLLSPMSEKALIARRRRR